MKVAMGRVTELIRIDAKKSFDGSFLINSQKTKNSMITVMTQEDKRLYMSNWTFFS